MLRNEKQICSSYDEECNRMTIFQACFGNNVKVLFCQGRNYVLVVCEKTVYESSRVHIFLVIWILPTSVVSHKGPRVKNYHSYLSNAPNFKMLFYPYIY